MVEPESAIVCLCIQRYALKFYAQDGHLLDPGCQLHHGSFLKRIQVQKRILNSPDFIGKCIEIHCKSNLRGRVVNGSMCEMQMSLRWVHQKQVRSKGCK